ncbi:hypothetical protein [Marinicellulosiphila megalodicopiae]|uniref:hypothetical protein n=1 Tax=Marinicellulosiphila megalodicopiae TaxID=2724896 RepID=UPI003BAF7210
MRQFAPHSMLCFCCLLPVLALANHNQTDEPTSHQYSNGAKHKTKLTISHSSNTTHTYSNANSSYSSSTSYSTHSHNNHHTHHHTGSLEGDLLYIFLEIFDDSLFYGGIASMERIDGSDGGLGLRPRVEGELLLPFFKFDASALSTIAQDEMGSDLSFEMGYGPWGLHYRDTQFFSESALQINSFQKFDFLYRMSFGSDFELDLGLGSYQVNGEPQFSLSFPMKIAFTPYNIIEFRPTWTQDVSDYDLAFYGGTEFYSFKVGYRYIVQTDIYNYNPEPIQAYSNIYAGFSAHY